MHVLSSAVSRGSPTPCPSRSPSGAVALVIFSYTQTILHYPHGGGAYIVAKDNLGTLPALMAGASLLIDYVLTVSVSVSAGVRALTSAFPAWAPYRVEIALGFVGVLTLGNLRGVQESRTDLRGAHILLHRQHRECAGGRSLAIRHRRDRSAARVGASCHGHRPADHVCAADGLLERVHGDDRSRGSVQRGTGVPATGERNAAATLVVMGVLSITMFLGITMLAHAYALVPNSAETVVSQLARATFGGGTRAVLQGARRRQMLILVLAANAAYADFPRLASIVARDRFLPRQFTGQENFTRLSNGILILSALAAVLLVAFAGDTHTLIPLYMIGVFVSFTLSQSGMVLHWRKSGGARLACERLRERRWRPGHGNRTGDRGDDQSHGRRMAHHPHDPCAGRALHGHKKTLRVRWRPSSR